MLVFANDVIMASMEPKVLLFAARNKSSAQTVKAKIQKWLLTQGIKVIDASETPNAFSQKELEGVRFGLVIGGDGTFLKLVAKLQIKNIFPLIGINLGTVGFITEIDEFDIIPALESALEGKLIEEKRSLLKVELNRGGKSIETAEVFNDAVITKDAHTTMVRLEIWLNSEQLTLIRSDGLIVATPTGSSAYSLSAGGPLLHPDLKGMVVTPICSHTLAIRSIVFPESVMVKIGVHEFEGSSHLVYDGQLGSKLQRGDEIFVQVSQSYVRLLSAKKRWSEALHTKLHMA